MDAKSGWTIVIRKPNRLEKEEDPGVDQEVLEEGVAEDLDQEVETEEDN